MVRLLFFFALLSVTLEGLESLPIAGFRLTPPENVWARIGESVTLRCKSDKPIRSCAWMTPYEKNYVLEEGLKAEGGRLSYYSEEEMDGSSGVTECGIRIRAIQEQDLGKWSCNIGVVEGDEIKSAAGQASIRLASAPSDLSLSFSPQIDLNGSLIEPKASCGVSFASPKPKFEWLIDGEGVVDPEVSDTFSEENEEYVQVLTNLKDILESENATLTCIVSHMALNESLSESIEIYVEEEEEESIYPDDMDATMDVDLFGLLEEEDDLNEIPILIIIAVAILLTLSAIFFILHRRGKLRALCKGGRHEVIDMDKNDGSQDLEGKINHHVDDSESTDSIVKQVVPLESESSSNGSTEEKKDLPEKKSESQEETPGSNDGEVINHSQHSNNSKDNDVTFTVNRFLSKFSLKNIIPHPTMANENDLETTSKEDGKDSKEEII